MLYLNAKTTRSSEKLILKLCKASNNKLDGGGGRADKMIKILFKFKKSKKNKCRNVICISIIAGTKEPIFLTSKSKKSFNCLRHAFIKAPIFKYFDLESYIQSQIYALSYAISVIFSQLSSNDAAPNDSILIKSHFGHWHLVVYFSGKI